MKDIELIPTDDLIQELQKRFEAIIIHGTRENKNKDVYTQHWKGNYSTCLGLCEIMKELILKNWEKDTFVIKPEDL